MVRKVAFTVRPAPTLAALLSYAQATRAHRGGLGDRLDREVRLALESAARTLDPVLGLLRWLGRRSLARSSGYVDATGLAAEVTVAVDLRAAVAAAVNEGSRVDGRAYTDLYSLRALARALRGGDLLGLDGVLLGRQADTARALVRALDAACREAAIGDESMVPKAFAQRPMGVPAPAPKADPPQPKPKPKAATTASFGGLPDDATSAPPSAAVEESPKSARGLTLDAEFFLESARLKGWPCSAKVLARARKSVLLGLHPDRAGDASEESFRRAVKGHAELAAALSATPTPATKPAPATTPTVVAAPAPAAVPARASAIGQWPPPPPAAVTLVEATPPPARRQSFKRSSKA